MKTKCLFLMALCLTCLLGFVLVSDGYSRSEPLADKNIKLAIVPGANDSPVVVRNFPEVTVNFRIEGTDSIPDISFLVTAQA